MNTKHTPAPWQILWGNYTHFATINKDTSQRICAIEVNIPAEIAEQTANARLIAAAPEMLEALQNVVKIVSPTIHRMSIKKAFDETLALNEAVKAIRKATL
jgi:hypothetical protein